MNTLLLDMTRITDFRGLHDDLTLGVLISLMLATVLLGFFDILLPRGDVIGVSGALDMVALALFGPAVAALSSLVGVLGAFLTRRSMNKPVRVIRTFIARIGALSVSSLLFVQLKPWTVKPDALVWLELAVIFMVYLFVEFALLQIISASRTNRSLVRLMRGNSLGQLPVMSAQLSAALLAVLIFDTMGEWSLILVVALLLLIRESYVLLLEIRETYRTTVEVLVEAAEGVEAGQTGHAERTARIARSIAERCGFAPAAIERLNYAALLHDLQLLAGAPGEPPTQRSSSILREIEHFDEVTRVLRICDGIVTSQDHLSELDMLSAYIVALSSDIDVLSNPAARTMHPGSATKVVTLLVPASLRSKAVGAAVHLGYRVPSLP